MCIGHGITLMTREFTAGHTKVYFPEKDNHSVLYRISQSGEVYTEH